MQLSSKLNDKLFCVIDIDLSELRYQKIESERQKLNKTSLIQFVLSNPCFEIWLLYYFTKDPKIENSSKKVKEQLKKYVPQYDESFDIVEKCNLLDKTNNAIENAELKNQMYNEATSLLDKNPYTEIPKLLKILLNFRN